MLENPIMTDDDEIASHKHSLYEKWRKKGRLRRFEFTDGLEIALLLENAEKYGDDLDMAELTYVGSPLLRAVQFMPQSFGFGVYRRAVS